MPITRHFLGWDGPLLPRVATYLREQLGRGDDGFDLSHLIAVLPAQRAGRRLLELLVIDAQNQDAALNPPQIVTAGKLPELLYQPQGRQAGDIDAQLAFIDAMRNLPIDSMADLLPHAPAPEDLPGWWAYATQLRRLRDDLAAHRMTFADVSRLCADRGVDLRGEQRWAVLDQIEQAYQDTLRSLKLTDRDTDRIEAITSRRCTLESDKHIVLIAAPDLNDTAAAMLRLIDDRITSLIMAPDQHAEGFDDLGVLRADYWARQRIDLQSDQLTFVGRNSDQAAAVIDAVAEAQQHSHDLSADQVTVGLGDEHFAGPVRRRLDLADIPCRSAAGSPTAQSRPALLLRALSRFMESHRLDALAELLRHPDIQSYLERDHDDAQQTIDDWLTLLDQYATDHLQGQLTSTWLGDPERIARLKQLHNKITTLLPEHFATRKPLPQWSETIATALQTVYADTSLREYVQEEHQLALALEQIADRLREQAELKDTNTTTPDVTASQAIALTLRRLNENVIPDEHDGPAVELLGYLELPLDDAPILSITNLNEGLIPSSRNADAFLPDSVRSKLSMHDNARRFGRDLMLLNAIIHSRPFVRLIASRRTDEGDPLSPSRLLLACDDTTLIKRIQSFFSDDENSTPPTLPIKPAGRNRFLIPKPIIAPKPLEKLSVTAFRAYIACPYRFYLRYVLKLASLNDQAIEMDPMSFGSITHTVLQVFGQSDLKHETNPTHIQSFLNSALDNTIESQFGEDRRSVIRIQTEQLRERLNAFAKQQAKLTQDGWLIQHAEQELSTTITVDDIPFKIKGKIDRIDHHEQLGYRVFDYKTGDTDHKPDQTHRTGRGDERTWVDLQLPLYRELCKELKITGPIELGYFNLPKKRDRVGPSLADWSDDDFADATLTRDAVIRAIRDQHFWPPNEVAGLPDGYERICADTAMQRDELIDASFKQGGAS